MHKVRFLSPAGTLLPLHPRTIRRLLSAMVQALLPHAADADVEIVLVRDAWIAALNRRYLQRLGPTNCLAFPAAGSGDKALRGSLFVSVDTWYRECLLYGQAPKAHLGRLLAHGLTHLAGFDHGEEMDAWCVRLESVWAEATTCDNGRLKAP